ncbi:MAG: DUF3363 domain-containing protein [Alteraurantiacibacter sp. bin_em_oilr2.035]|nr:DUF3363 domain-containing protein [Alteraurantiacibacter sp. bin_em_oilr2.035]
MADDDFNVRPGRSGDSGERQYRKANTLVGRVLQSTRRAGHTPLHQGKGRRGTGRFGRGRHAALGHRRSPGQRGVVIKARVVRHGGARFRSAPLTRHISYLERDGVTKDGSRGRMFDVASDEADGVSFAERCEDDRHHFRFIVSPEDANEMSDLRAFTRELMTDMASDLDTRLDWVAVDHWNTDNPHIHVLVRGIGTGGEDLVIDRAYIGEGMRARAEERVTIELGPRNERDIQNALAREVDAERWTSLDRRLHKQRGAFGEIDLRPEAGSGARTDRSILIGRVKVLERMGLAEQVGPASWTLAFDIEPTLRALGERGDIIKTMHRAMSGQGLHADPAHLALHDDAKGEHVIGRLVERGLHDELTGKAYAIVDGVDGRIHHLRFPDLERTGDAAPGAIVQASAWTDRKGRQQTSLLVRSDLSLESQIDAGGATWLDRQIISPRLETVGGGFGSEVREALGKRADVLVEQGLAKRQGQKIFYARNLLGTLRQRELAEASDVLASRHGGTVQSATTGGHVAGIYRERVTLASGRFALIDNGAGFQLVPWRQDLQRHLGQAVTGRVNERGGVDWSFARSRGPAV